MTKKEERLQRQAKKLADERQRLAGMREFEHKYKEHTYICGIDEAGRGPLAGPVAAAAVVLPKDLEILYLNDSKKLTQKRREALFEEITKNASAYGIGVSSAGRIDEINILRATYEAMQKALFALESSLGEPPGILLIDAVHLPDTQIRQVSIIGGDAKSVSIAAASVIAKVSRDRMMEEYDRLYPEYGFAANKGYGTVAHIEALRKYGPCPIHRKSFIGNFVSKEEELSAEEKEDGREESL